MGIEGDAFDLDLAAASLGADEPDVRIMLGQLVARLVSLGERMKVERTRGLLRKGGEIRRLEIAIGRNEFVASMESGAPEFRVGLVSGGIKIRTETLDADAWLKALIGALQEEAAHSATSREALEAIVIGER